MDEEGGAIVRGRGHRDLELARQVSELGMQRRPLAHQLGVWPRIHDLVACNAGKVIAGDVANTVARCLDRMHLHRSELCQNIGHVLEFRPVELKVLPRREMSVSAIVSAPDARERAQLARRQEAIGN